MLYLPLLSSLDRPFPFSGLWPFQPAFFSHLLPVLLFFPFLSTSGSGGCREDQRRSAPRGAKDVAFPSEHLQPAGVHPGCSPVSMEHQTLYHMSGNHSRKWQNMNWKHILYVSGNLQVCSLELISAVFLQILLLPGLIY